MKEKFLLIIIILFMTSPAAAWNDRYNDNNKYLYQGQERVNEQSWGGSHNDESFYQRQEREREEKMNTEYPYVSTTGTRYKYDLSKPCDRIKYGVDPGAQIHDSINPNVEIDRELGQYGGGSK